MKKHPIYYKSQIVGYVDDIIHSNNVVETIKIYFFYSEHYTDIVENIKKSIYSTLDLYDNINNKYNIELDGDYLICKLIK